MRILHADRYPSPIGGITLLAAGDSLCYLDFSDGELRLQKLLKVRFGEYVTEERPGLLGMTQVLDRYFAGDQSAFEGLRLDAGGTSFQKSVWEELVRIPAGETISYGELAVRIGKPSSVRAVAGANARNPISIVIPCHRVIGSDGSLTGYAGGVERKRWLLEHEGVRFPASASIFQPIP